MRNLYEKILVTVLIVAVVVLAGFLVWQNWPQPSPIAKNQPLDETANWLTYKNEQYGFEVKYPKNWYSYESEGMEVISTFPKEDYEKYYFAAPEGQKLGESYGLVWINFPDKSLEEFLPLIEKSIKIQKQPNSPYKIENDSIKDLNIDGLKGYRMRWLQKYFVAKF